MELSIIRLIISWVLGIISTTAIKFQGKFEWDTEEHVTLKISDEGRYKRSRGGVTSFPDVMGINFDTANTSVSLSLRRNYGLDENLPVYVIKENSLVLQTLPLVTDTAFYQDVKHGAAFTVKFDEKTSKVLNLFGTLRLNNAAYFMERSGDFESGDDSHFRLRKYKVMAGKFVDIVQRKVGHGSDSKSDTSDFDKTRNSGKTGTGSDAIPSSRVKRSAVEQTVELMFTTDYSIYSYWYSDSNATSTAQKDLDAKTSIRQFYAHAINEVDAMYASVDSSSISINVVFACLVISESVATSEWTETRVSGGKVDASDVLNNYTAWEQQLAISPCGYDHAMLFSKYDFTSTAEGVVSSAVAGLAWLSGACDSLKQSISEDSFDYDMNVIAAHELGHNLGADHDGDGNSCPENNKNIMSPSIGPGPSSARDNPWKFSSCSVTYFETYVTKLNTDTNNCLLTLSSDHDPTALTPYDQGIPGQVITADEQCVRLEGAGSHLCREFYTSDYSSMCYSMKCRISGSTSCNIYTAATGTTCGNQKWCFQSSCIANSSAPVVSDTCPYGDNPGIVYTDGSNTYTCATLFQAFNKGLNCPSFLTRCCATCEAVYTSIP
ncbi:A disintegrin and metalloproteinase with thrombospondin motifs 6-like, partial [Mizuhopecten yessoensis]|uniref:A disintegrin and metalloproteinase with thrombospondin motifs 6-like n=1 Tax=Mizuhopecten yessoensis TaxID=6573 RepID=UPI000B45A263